MALDRHHGPLRVLQRLYPRAIGFATLCRCIRREAVIDIARQCVTDSALPTAAGFNQRAALVTLETAVGRARVGRCGRVWVGATTQLATACKAKQRPQTWLRRLNRVRSAVTQKVSAVVAIKVSVHAALPAAASGQLRFLGSLLVLRAMCHRVKPVMALRPSAWAAWQPLHRGLKPTPPQLWRAWVGSSIQLRQSRMGRLAPTPAGRPAARGCAPGRPSAAAGVCPAHRAAPPPPAENSS